MAILSASGRFWDTCEKYSYYFLSIAAVCIGFLFYNYWATLDFPKQKDARLYTYGTLNAVQIWFLIMGFIGLAKTPEL